MMTASRDILDVLDEYKKTPEAYGIGLRMNLAECVIAGMRSGGWSIAGLASASNVCPDTIASILHSDIEVTFGTAGRLLHVLEAE